MSTRMFKTHINYWGRIALFGLLSMSVLLFVKICPSTLIYHSSHVLEENSSLSWFSIGVPRTHAKPKAKKKKRKSKKYDRKRRASEQLISEGHPVVEITLKTEPRVRARVYHGKELIGVTPMTLKWAKDTGPIDVVLKASGYLKVNSRFYTYRNDRVTVKMFKEDQSHLLFGYKKKIKPKETAEDILDGSTGGSSPTP